ncbi:hypothetical protein PVOR_22129 [Paenibacillus vortex V453]|jgi:hypothetical protein|uniref:Glycosyltransferase RgtA/B/C/D-like domain-containing protein n=2 Tax=Paenibacillus TaxID=44249 RepID=A0A163E6U6_9BACL|nr:MULTISPECIES: DUF6080 domain-containing protein [Paenibacillus]ANA83069.1 hypothetical protein A3958_25230 [Paenibacillus glucanolyticus]AVV57841.1 hypothetical protein C7121_17780 [Paenibacillus glucanolyticus]AWP27002.1 hypothetical protein B9D94_10370 [Paenibacillus sp. Cedars]EFU40016.1 hypothetical protein PVOR_22129 [Paenibacillus vortex V453]ETT34624.1 hypothetical protein C169_19739 [Paenibacillus sp. FSL R5-808]
MTFFRYLFRHKKDNYTAIGLSICLALWYVFMNLPFVTYIKDHAATLMPHSPFYGAPFTLNLFNFDPSMEYGPENISIIHPFINFLTSPLTSIIGSSNLPYLLIQSVLNALSAALVYYIIRRGGAGWVLSLVTAAFFGFSSYSLYTAFIPDSYAYAQFMIILSAAYLQHNRIENRFGVMPNASLALINFGITSTNVATFSGALLISMLDRRMKHAFKRFIIIMLVFLGMVVIVTLLQHLLFSGKSWIGNVFTSMQNGALSYVSPFSFTHHSRVFYMLFVSPILSPELAMIDPGIAAFVTDLSKPYPIHVHIVGLGMLLLAVLSFIKGIKSRDTWAFSIYILFAILLHVIVGFGLATYNYDMYLYAGHYLFAVFVLAAMFIAKLNSYRIQQALTGIMILFLFITLVNNIVLHGQTLDYIQTTYDTVFHNIEK